MQTQGKETQYAEVIKVFSFVLSQYRLYSEKHPAAQLAVRNFLARLEVVVGSEPALVLAFVGGRLVVNDHALDNKKTGVAELLRETNRLHIESLTFDQGATEDEFNSLFKVIATPIKTLEEMGGFKKVFEEAKLKHIRLGAARIQIIKEEEAVVKKSGVGQGGGEGGDAGERSEAAKKEKAAPAGRGRKIERMEELVEHLLKGAGEKIELTLDLERLAYEVEKKPELVAREVLRRAEDLETLKRIVEDLGRFLQEHLARPSIQEGKDFSPRISRFAKEFKKTVEGPDVPGDFKVAVEELVARLERCADEVKLELITKAFQESGGAVTSLAKIGAKFLRGKEIRERLIEPLRERLSALGVGEKDLDRAFAAVEEKRAPKKSGQVEVAPEELEELRRIRDHFAEELALRVKHQTAALEREKKRLLDEKERVDTIIRSIGEGLVVVDGEGKIQFMNPAAEKLLGLDQKGAKGVPIPELVKGEHTLALAKGPLRDEEGHVTKEIEVKSSSEDAQRIVQASTAVIENQEGKTVGMVSVLSDITKQKQLDEAKSKFVAHVSHELRTPLLAIEESLSLLMGKEVGEVSPEQEKFLSIAHRNITRLARLVNDLLDVAKLEAGRIELHPISFELRDMVHHVVETVRSWAESKQVAIEEVYPEKAVPIVADADRLTQVVTNLLGNAIKFTPEGGKICVEINPDDLASGVVDGSNVAVSVQDSGIGIPKADQKRIFEKFEQVSLASPQGVSSTGLGLTIAKEIVELHGGRIWVDSNEGEGSRFTFVIRRQLQSGVSAGQALG
ncbi:MAG: PAS domain S-box protein [Deltaproteobacteria bacterium]|nr:PAS domain S-box protein [Deltaproteobacteria bacterium]